MTWSNICEGLWIFVSLEIREKNQLKNLSSKYCQKLLDHAKQSATDEPKTAVKRAVKKTAEAIEDLNGSKITDKIIRIPNTWPQNNSVTNEEEILRERYISPEKRQQIINDLRLI